MKFQNAGDAYGGSRKTLWHPVFKTFMTELRLKRLEVYEYGYRRWSDFSIEDLKYYWEGRGSEKGEEERIEAADEAALEQWKISVAPHKVNGAM